MITFEIIPITRNPKSNIIFKPQKIYKEVIDTELLTITHDVNLKVVQGIFVAGYV